MAIIFFFSSRERAHVSDVYSINFIFFKSLHVIEYAALYFLIFRAVLKGKERNKKRAWVVAFVVAVLYAISDEVHQTFVPTREGKVRDVGIDILGMSLMYAYSKYHITTLKRFL